MDDQALVRALRSRDPEAPAALYDSHAGPLYGYCWFRLCDHDAAQAALCEAFILAEAHIGRLRDPGRLGLWLYALARLECDRRESGGGTVTGAPVADPDQENVDQRITAWRAVRGMPPPSREALELRVRHRLPVPDLAVLLDLPVRETQRVLARANADLQESLTAELLAKEGPYGCPGRAAILRERRGELTAPLRRRLLEHAQECTVCGRFRRRAVSPVKVYGLLPEATPPESLRTRVLSCFGNPQWAAYRRSVAARPMDFDGAFPVRRRTGTSPLPERQVPDEAAAAPESDDATERAAGRRVVLVTAASACLVLSAAALGAILHGNDHGNGHGNDHGDDRIARGRVVPTATVSSMSRQPIAMPERDASGAWAVGEVRASPTWPLGATGSSAPPTARPTPPEGHGAGPGTPGRPGDPGLPGGPGVLVASPRYLDLGGRSSGSIELLAQGGPVDWRARTPDRIRLSRASGRLDDGRPVTLWLRVARRQGSSGQDVITFQPGGIRVVVTWRSGPFGGPPPDPGPPSPSAPGGPSQTVPSVPPSRPGQDPSSDPPSSGPPSQAPSDPPPSDPPPSDPPSSDPPSSGSPEPPPSSGPSPAPEPAQT